MQRTGITILIAGLVLAGCGIQQRDFSQLPADPVERARLCTGAATLHAHFAETAALAPAEQQRRNAMKQRLRDATEFDDHFTAAERETADAEINRWADEGVWLSMLNRCIEGYGLGEPEPIPPLPTDAAERLYVCALSSAVKARGSDTESNIDPALDPQGFHFVLQIRTRFGADALRREAGRTEELATRALRQGAVDEFVDRCVAEFPRAALDHRTELPNEEPLRAEICAAVLDQLVVDSDANRAREEYLPRARRIFDPLSAALDAHAPGDRSAFTTAELDAAMVELGPSTSIFAACERAYSEG